MTSLLGNRRYDYSLAKIVRVRWRSCEWVGECGRYFAADITIQWPREIGAFYSPAQTAQRDWSTMKKNKLPITCVPVRMTLATLDLGCKCRKMVVNVAGC
jgi:hypothetical protein